MARNAPHSLFRRFTLLGTMLVVAAAGLLSLGMAPAGDEDGGEFPDSWYYIDRKTGERYAKPRTLEGKPAPKLELKDWIGEPPDLKELEGHVVVVDFWATWCGPCRASIPKNIKLVEKYKDENFIFLGVHDSNRGYDAAPKMAKDKSINYPIAIDDGGTSQKAWKVSFWPTYAVVDHKGVVRAAGLNPESVGKVVEKLIDEMKAEQEDEA